MGIHAENAHLLLTSIRNLRATIWDAAIHRVEADRRPPFWRARERAMTLWDSAILACKADRLDMATTYMRDARAIASFWGTDIYELRILEFLESKTPSAMVEEPLVVAD